MHPTPQQEDAARLPGSAMTVASAGTGKTTTLVLRVMNVLSEEHARPPEEVTAGLVVVTFTELAAAEMRGRILREVILRARQGGTDANYWRGMSRSLDTAYIGTIHGLCARLLREFGSHVALPIAFTVADEQEAGGIWEEVVEESMRTFPSEEPPAEHPSAALVRLLRSKREGRVRELLGSLHSGGSEVVPYCEGLLRSGSPGLTDRILSQWQELVPDAGDPTDEDRTAAALHADLARVYLRLREEFERRKARAALLDFDDLVLKAREVVADPEAGPEIRSRVRHLIVDEFQDTDRTQAEVLTLLAGGETPDSPAELFAVHDPKQSIYGWRHARPENAHTVARSWRERGAHVRDLVLTGSFRHRPNIRTFVNQVFRPLFDGQGAGADRTAEPGRGSDPLPTTLGYSPLEAPDPAPTGWDEGEGGAVEWLVPENRDTPPPGEGSDRTERLRTQALILAERIRLAVEEGGDRVTPLVGGPPRGVRWGDVMVLLRSRTHLRLVEESLRARGVPYVTLGGLGFYGAQEVMDACAVLEFLSDPTNDIALASILRSPLVALPDASLFTLGGERVPGEDVWRTMRAWAVSGEDSRLNASVRLLERWLRLLEDEPTPGEVLRAVFLSSGGIGAYCIGPRGRQAEANLAKLLSMARDVEGRGRSGVRALSWRLRRLIDNPPMEGEDPVPEQAVEAVRILTVHAAKGLEAPVVAIPFMDRDLSKAGNSRALWHHEGRFIFKVDEDEPDDSLRKSARDKLRDTVTRAEQEEEKRLFYVATTRAGSLLLLVGAPGDPPRGASWQSWMQDSIPDLREGSASTGGPCVRLRPVCIPPRGGHFQIEEPPELTEGLSPGALSPEGAEVTPPYFGNLVARDLIQTTVTALAEVGQDDRRGQGTTPLSLQRERRRAGKLGSDAHELLGRFMGSDRGSLRRWAGQGGIKPAGEESSAELRGWIVWALEHLDSLRPTHDLAEVPVRLLVDDVVVTGRIDRLLKLSDESWYVVDFKSGATPDVEGSVSLNLENPHHFQVAVYALACRPLAGGAPLWGALLYLGHRRAVRLALGPGELERTECVLQERISALRGALSQRA